MNEINQDDEVLDFINSVLKTKSDEDVVKILHGKRSRAHFWMKLTKRARELGDDEFAARIDEIMGSIKHEQILQTHER